MSPHGCVAVLAEDGFPRVSGDEPGRAARDDCGQGFSPRERG